MRHANSSIEQFTPAMFYILLVLADRDRHGYGIMQEVMIHTDGGVRLAPGTLYRSIKSLVAMGMIVECGERPDPELDDERRRYYRITDVGRHAAEGEAERLARLVRVAQSKHLLLREGRALLEGSE
ncbi:MAG: helix-turn-helix transcriptional regulator [Chloroflexota bacterium]